MIRIVLRLVFLVVLVAVICAGWIAVRGWLAKDHLAAAADQIARLETQLEQGNTSSAQTTTKRIQSDTADAVRLTDDPVWRVGSHFPWFGDDLTAVHAVSVSAHTAATQALPPIASAAGDVNRLRNRNGDLNVRQVVAVARRLQTPLASSQAGVKRALTQINAVDRSGLIGPIQTGVSELTNGLTTLDNQLTGLRRVDAAALAALGQK